MDMPTLGWRVVNTYRVPGFVPMYCATAAYWSRDRPPPPYTPLPAYTLQGYGNTEAEAIAACRLACRDDLGFPHQADPNPSAPTTTPTTAQDTHAMTPAGIRERLPSIAQQLAALVVSKDMPAGLEVGGEHVASISATVTLIPRDGQGEPVWFTLSVGTGSRDEDGEPEVGVRVGPHETGAGDIPFS